MSTVRERITGIVKKHVKVSDDQLLDSANLSSDLGVDSLTLFEVILDMEKEFSCEIPEKDSNNIVSIGAAISYIESKIQDGSAK
ncbi:MAG: acyl carrier protein [Holosporales bacterium]|jgi:acyl carrier protein|nr:acyl carrier protein [Holosporales bacterium]